MKSPRISLEQWAAFKAVVDEGSFARAAEHTAAQLAKGIEPEVVIAADGLLEPGQLIPVLDNFSRTYPMTRLRVLETQLSGTEEALLEKKAHLVILHQVPIGHIGVPLCVVRMIAVAHPRQRATTGAGRRMAWLGTTLDSQSFQYQHQSAQSRTGLCLYAV